MDIIGRASTPIPIEQGMESIAVILSAENKVLFVLSVFPEDIAAESIGVRDVEIGTISA
jgi:hypothetical protein